MKVEYANDGGVREKYSRSLWIGRETSVWVLE